MRLKLIFILSTLMFTLFAVPPDNARADFLDKCLKTSSDAKVVAKKEGKEALYNITVTNLFDTPIVSIYIDSSSLKRTTSEDITPISMTSPEGWAGEVQKLSTFDMFYHWHVSWDNKNYYDSMIQRGRTLSGFKLHMPAPMNTVAPLKVFVIFEADFTYCSQVTLEIR